MTRSTRSASSQRPVRATIQIVAASTAFVAGLAAGALVLRGYVNYEVPGSSAAAIGYLVAVLALGGVSVATSIESRMPRHHLSVASAATALAFAYAALAPLVIAGIPSALRLTAASVAVLAPAALLHLAAAVTRPAARFLRALVPLAYALCGAFGAMRSLVTDRFLDPGCRVACDEEAIVLVASPSASFALGVALIGVVVLTAAAALLTALLPIAQSGSRRSAPWPPLLAVAAASITVAATAIAPHPRPALGPPPPGGEALFLARCMAVIGVAAAVSVWRLQRVRRHARLANAFEAVVEASGAATLPRVLGQALRDPHLQLVYWLPTLERWSDADGRRAEPPAGGIAIVRSGRPIAHVTSSRASIDAEELEEVVGAAAALVVDNERLRVEQLAQTAELRESSRRVVETTDAERRSLERELHDGAQQRLLAASAALRLALEEAPDSTTTAQLRARLDEVLALLATLREISRGLYPPTLAGAGLSPALESLARTSATPLSLHTTGSNADLAALDAEAALTACLTVREAVASGRGVPAVVTLAVVDGVLRIDLAGVPGYRVGRIADRVIALGGAIGGNRGRIRVEVPCGS